MVIQNKRRVITTRKAFIVIFTILSLSLLLTSSTMMGPMSFLGTVDHTTTMKGSPMIASLEKHWQIPSNDETQRKWNKKELGKETLTTKKSNATRNEQILKANGGTKSNLKEQYHLEQQQQQLEQRQIKWIPPLDCPKGMLAGNKKMTSEKISLQPTWKYADSVAIVTLAMKQPRFQNQIFELVQSVRSRGAWMGPIVIFTDATPLQILKIKMTWERAAAAASSSSTTKELSQVHVISVEPKDILPLKKPFMTQKRFKTWFFDLIQQQPEQQGGRTKISQLKKIEYLVFMDADVLIGNPFGDFLDQVLPFMETHDILMFQEQGRHSSHQQFQKNITTMYHSGIIVMHKIKSKQCLKGWQERFDSDQFVNDQSALVDLLYNTPQSGRNNNNNDNNPNSVKKNYTNVQCNIHELPKQHLMMPNLKPIRQGKVATFIHFTHARLKKLKKYLDPYKKCTLMLDVTTTSNK